MLRLNSLWPTADYVHTDRRTCTSGRFGWQFAVGDKLFVVHWRQIYQHEDFRKELCKVWNTNFVPAIQKMIDDEAVEYESGSKNLAWYEEYVVGIHYLENSRWDTMYLWNRCGEIRDFLEFRLDALSKHLNEK